MLKKGADHSFYFFSKSWSVPNNSSSACELIFYSNGNLLSYLCRGIRNS